MEYNVGTERFSSFYVTACRIPFVWRRGDYAPLSYKYKCFLYRTSFNYIIGIPVYNFR